MNEIAGTASIVADSKIVHMIWRKTEPRACGKARCFARNNKNVMIRVIPKLDAKEMVLYETQKDRETFQVCDEVPDRPARNKQPITVSVR